MRALTITTDDGYPIAATRYPTLADSGAEPILVIAGATGVPQSFYRRIALWFAEQGVTVLTFDYRGIAASAPITLRGFKADYLDWAERDLAACVDWAADRGPTVVLGHSFGGHAYGLLPNVSRTLGLYTFATSAGWHGYMPLGKRLEALALWHAIGPVLTSLYGFLPSHMVGLGEDLPLGVYQQWKRWCAFPRYYLDDPDHDMAARLDRVTQPVVGVNATDDDIGQPASASAFLTGYRRADLSLHTVKPSDLGLNAIGHMGYVRPPASALWPDVMRFIQRVAPDIQVA